MSTADSAADSAANPGTYLEDIARMNNFKIRCDLEKKVRSLEEQYEQVSSEADNAQRKRSIVANQLVRTREELRRTNAIDMRREEIIAQYKRAMKYFSELSDDNTDTPSAAASDAAPAPVASAPVAPVAPMSVAPTPVATAPVAPAPVFRRCGPAIEPWLATITTYYKTDNYWHIDVHTKDERYIATTNKIPCHMGVSCSCADSSGEYGWKESTRRYLEHNELSEYEYSHDENIKAENPPANMVGYINLVLERAFNTANCGVGLYKVPANWNGSALGYTKITSVSIPTDIKQCCGVNNHFTAHSRNHGYNMRIQRAECESNVCVVSAGNHVRYIVRYRDDQIPLVLPVHPSYTVRKISAK